MIIYSLMILLKPNNLNLGIYSLILLIIPILVYKLFNDFRNNYLKYSSELSKIIFNFVGIFLSFNIFIFISLLIFKFFTTGNNYIISNNNNKTPINNNNNNEINMNNSLTPNIFIFFIPLYSIIFILLLFAIFLRKGFTKMNKTLTHNLIIFNLIITLFLISLIYLKVNSISIKASWFHIMVLVSFYQGGNYFGFSHITKSEKISNKNPSIEDKKILFLLDLILNISAIAFYLFLGLFIDNKIKVNYVILFVIFWVFFIVLIFKGLYKIKKIKDFLEWRKVSLK